MKTIIEPFRMKVIEPIRMTSRSERERLIRDVHFNLFAIHSEDVLIDLLTDSGTGAMSANQWGALMRGDESYAGSPSFYRFQAAVQRLMPFRQSSPLTRGGRPRRSCSRSWAAQDGSCRRTLISTRPEAISRRRVPKRSTSQRPRRAISQVSIL